LKFSRSRASVTLDFKDAIPTALALGVLVKKATTAGLWDARVRIKRAHRFSSVFDTWWTESESGDTVTLRLPIGLKEIANRN